MTKANYTSYHSFEGVVFDKRLGKWNAKRKLNKKQISLGMYTTHFAACYARHFSNIKHGIFFNKRPLKERFDLSYIIDKNSGCWTWIMSTYSNGYGKINNAGKNLMAHRCSYELHNGDIPKGMYVCHKCDNPSCVNPDHLFAGTPTDNVEDMIKKGRNNPPKKIFSENEISYILSYNGKQRDLAIKFNVSECLISRIINKKSESYFG